MEHTSFDFVLKNVPLASDETVLGKWYASKLFAGLSMHGGQIILTSSRVIFRPINLDGLQRVTKALAGHAKFMVTLTGKVTDRTGQIISIPFDQIQLVKSIKPSLISSGKVGITLKNRSYYEFGFVATLLSPLFLPRNAQLRDDFVQQLQAMLE